MKKRHGFRLVGCLLLLAPLVVTATPPEAPPYHAYRVSGRVVGPGGEPLANVAVALAANCGDGGEYHLVRPGANEYCCIRSDLGSPVALTDAQGGFFVNTVMCERLDSLSVAVVLANETVMGTPFAAADATSRQPVEESRAYEEESFMCATSVGYNTVVIGYQSTYPSRTVVVE